MCAAPAELLQLKVCCGCKPPQAETLWALQVWGAAQGVQAYCVLKAVKQTTPQLVRLGLDALRQSPSPQAILAVKKVCMMRHEHAYSVCCGC